MDIQQILNLGINEDDASHLYSIFLTEIDELKTKLNTTKTEHLIDIKLLQAGSKNIKATKSLLDFNLIKLKDENITGIDEQIDMLKRNPDSSFLFNSPISGNDQISDNNFKGIVPADSLSKNTTKVTQNMSYTELCNYYNNLI